MYCTWEYEGLVDLVKLPGASKLHLPHLHVRGEARGCHKPRAKENRANVGQFEPTSKEKRANVSHIEPTAKAKRAIVGHIEPTTMKRELM